MPETCRVITRPARYVDPEPAETCDEELTPEGLAAFKRNVPIAYTWEPVIFRRALPRRDGDPIGRDHLSEPITMRKGFTGAKPDKFNRWILDLIGYQEGDVMHDFFPGTGGMGATLAAAPLDLGWSAS